MFEKSQIKAAINIYDESIKPCLRVKDGKVHVVMINSFSKWINQSFDCESKYTNQIDAILFLMQKDGYEIIDIKFNSLKNQGLSGEMEGFHTLIIYK